MIAKLYDKYFIKIQKKRNFRKNNRHNSVSIESSFWPSVELNKIHIGNRSYGRINVEFYCDEDEELFIGSYCSLASNCTFICGGNHRYNTISTFPFNSNIFGKLDDSVSNGPIVVDDDVWVGHGSTILSGVHIGQGAVIAAGSVVTNDIPPYSIVGGVPAKVIKYRFEPEMIEELLKIDYSKLNIEEIKKHIGDLSVDLKDKEQIDWMPKR